MTGKVAETMQNTDESVVRGLVASSQRKNLHLAAIDTEANEVVAVDCGQTLPPKSTWGIVYERGYDRDDFERYHSPCAACAPLRAIDGVVDSVVTVEVDWSEYPFQENPYR